MSNNRFYLLLIITLLTALQVRSVLFGTDFIFSPVATSLLDECVTFAHSLVRSLADHYTPMTMVIIIAIYMPLQSSMLENVVGLAYPNYKQMLALKRNDPNLAVTDAIALSRTNRLFVCGWPVFKIAIHICVFYLFLYPLLTFSPVIDFQIPLLYSLIIVYWVAYLLSNWQTLHVSHKQISFHVALLITVLMIFFFPHALALYFVVSAVTELLVNKSQRVFYSEKQKTAVQS